MSIYIEVAGTTAHVGGRRGTTRLFDYSSGRGGTVVGALVALDEEPVMLYVTLGKRSGDRNEWAEIAEWRQIDRDEFDRLTGLTEVRRQMGWEWD